MSVTVTVNGKSGPSVVATNGDTISAAVTKNAVVSVAASAAAAPGGTGPQGPAGPQATTITVGSTQTLSAGSSATVVGTSSNGGANLSLAFGIPAGATGAAGSAGAAGPTPTITATASTLSAGSSATVTATPSNGGANVALAFGIPRGADGSGGGASLSDATPAALGTASAGTASTASRSDHVHLLPSLSTLGAAAANHAHPYVTAINSLNGALTLAAGSNVTLTASGSTITIDSTGGVGANDTVDGGDYVGVVASISVTQHPADVSISINQGSTGSASFTVAASASTGVPVDYQWERNQGSAWAAIDAATSATLSLTGLAGADDGALYRCVVSAFGLPAVTSNSASLDVAVIVPSAPVITIATQPQPATIANTSTTASFSITASVNSGTLLYQWQKRGRGSSTWANVSGATSSTLSLSGLTYDIDRETYYRCRLTATGAAAVTSSPAQLAITWATAPQINITNGPSEVRYPSQSNAVTVTYDEQIFGGVTTARQWQALNGSSWVSPVPSVLSASNVPYGTTGASLTLYSISRDVTVRCVVTSSNSYGTTTATTASVLVRRPGSV